MKLKARQADWLDQVEALALLPPHEAELRLFPFERAKPHKDGLIVKFIGISDRNAADALRKCEVFVAQEALQAEPGEPVFLQQLADFAVVDSADQWLGQVVGFGTNGAQDLLRVKPSNGGEVLIPLVDDWILEIDFDKKVIRMELPPGLLSIENP